MRNRGYTCYACAVCSNHVHLVIRTHKDKSTTMLDHFTNSIVTRLRLRFPEEISPHHPVLSACPYKIFLYTAQDVDRCIRYTHENPIRETGELQRWDFVTPAPRCPARPASPRLQSSLMQD